MEDEKSSKAIRDQRFIPMVSCGSQLNYSIRSRAFQAKRSPEVPNLSFRLFVFKHRALHSSASLYSPLYAVFCAISQPLAPRDPPCSLLPLPSFPLAWSHSHSSQTGPPIPQKPSPNISCSCLAPAGTRQLETASTSVLSLIILPSQVAAVVSFQVHIAPFTKGFSSTIRLLSPNTTGVDALQAPRPLCLLPLLSTTQCHWLVSLQMSKYKFGFFFILLNIWP